MSAKVILYVEDNEMNRKIVRQLLKKTTYALVEAYDGEAGVAKALEIKPDLVLMDVQLPKLSGIDATRQLRAAPQTAATPILVITSFALSGDEDKAKEAGATGYLAKPYSPFDLLNRTGNWCRSKAYGRTPISRANESWSRSAPSSPRASSSQSSPSA